MSLVIQLTCSSLFCFVSYASEKWTSSIERSSLLAPFITPPTNVLSVFLCSKSFLSRCLMVW
uniref:Uncharacterized protein n=1 Tax=Rhizophora mucronata TaxID=61149 RepID=A0A2P2Q8V5_RHIMU